MGYLKGQNLRIKYGESTATIVAAATACTIHVAAQLEDASTKDDTADWGSQECVGKSWDCSSDALIAVETSGDSISADLDILDLIGKTVAVEFGVAQGTNNQTVAKAYSGNAIVNDIQINATNKQNVSYTVQMTGVGALTKAS